MDNDTKEALAALIVFVVFASIPVMMFLAAACVVLFLVKWIIL